MKERGMHGTINSFSSLTPGRETPQRRELGAMRVATPLLEVLVLLERHLDAPAWEDLRQDAIEHYVEWMLCRSLPRILDSLPLAGLDALRPEAVQRVTLLLVRDLCRQHAVWIQTAASDPAAARRRIETLFDEVAQRAGFGLDAVARFELDDVCRDAWAVELCAMVGIDDPVQISRMFVWHAAVSAGVGEGILPRRSLA
jgi:hypothetical protein